MTTATLSHVALARWLLTSQADEGGESLAAPEAAERVFQRLRLRLATLITPAGSEALLARAVHVAGTDFPFLQRMPRARTAEGLTAWLRQSADGGDPYQTAAGLHAALEALIALLVALIGGDLTMRLLRDVWPELPLPQPTPQSRNGHVEAHP